MVLKYGIMVFTQAPVEVNMAKVTDAKSKALKEQGCLHARPEKVIDELFQQTDFFDPRDLIQVKYEMLRRVRVEREPIRWVAWRFGFSRPSVYQALTAFDRAGLVGLVRAKPGPRRAHKLSEPVVKFIDEQKAQERSLRLDHLVERIKERFGLVVHTRSIQRALRRKQKKTA
jgi:transposase